MSNQKQNIARFLLSTQRSIFVHVRNDVPGNILPHKHKHQEQVVLQWGHNMPVPIVDLNVTKTGISGTLSFKGIPSHVFLSWDNVFAIVGEDGNGQIWPETMPLSIKRQVEAQKRMEDLPKGVSHINAPVKKVKSGYKHKAPENASRAHLRVV